MKGSKQLLADTYKRFFGHKNQAGPNVSAPSENVEEEADNDCFTLSQKPDSDTGDVAFVEYTEVAYLVL